MRFTTLSVATTTAIAVVNAAPVVNQHTYSTPNESKDVSKGLLNTILDTVNSIMDFETVEEPVETPGDHWKKVGKGYKKHWKKVGKGYKKKFTPPTDDDSDVESEEEFEVIVAEDGDAPETPGDHWKKVGKGYKKHWKKVGKGYKKKFTPPTDDDSDVESEEEFEVIVAEDGDAPETPGDHWKKVGKGYKKHWKKVGKGYKKKFTPPTDDDSDVESDVELLEENAPEDPHKYWKHYGKQQKKYWKKIGKEFKDQDPESEEELSTEAPADEDDDYWKKFGKDQKKYWKHYGKEQRKHWKKVGESPEGEEELVELSTEAPADEDDDYWNHYGKDQKKYWKHYGKDQKKHWKKVGKNYKKKYTPPAEDNEGEEYDVEALL
ncbi:hypothetical protein C6P40_004054 [Pichia californica]|uniref:Uncharacterized protein n=1 Tax=Pichia californica TaxID=460514 RepID=A0A9P7BHW4_9ASCO|nr:hypothetical protein C6P42_001115 [[Candida] californica]KAG0690003.1 hypothetical protein C6P40_004054 [[Candida] californica]